MEWIRAGQTIIMPTLVVAVAFVVSVLWLQP
jgi:hypothetical protein